MRPPAKKAAPAEGVLPPPREQADSVVRRDSGKGIRMMRVWVLGLVAVVWAGGSWAEDVVLQSIRVHTGAECQEILGEFNWICRDFERAEWIRLYERPFWDAGGNLLLYRYDFNQDGKHDAILTIDAPGARCPRGGDMCEHFFLFGGGDIPERTLKPKKMMFGRPVFSTRDGISGIYFDRYPEDFLTIDQVRDEALTSEIFEP